MTILIREYGESDLSDLLAVWEAASAMAHPFLPPAFVDEVRENIPKLYLPNAETWVAEYEERVIGFIAVLGNEVGAIFVAPEHQGMGVGRALMDKGRERRGELEVEVFADNSIGREFYRSYGFEQIEHKKHEPTGLVVLRLRVLEGMQAG